MARGLAVVSAAAPTTFGGGGGVGVGVGGFNLHHRHHRLGSGGGIDDGVRRWWSSSRVAVPFLLVEV